MPAAGLFISVNENIVIRINKHQLVWNLKLTKRIKRIEQFGKRRAGSYVGNNGNTVMFTAAFDKLSENGYQLRRKIIGTEKADILKGIDHT